MSKTIGGGQALPVAAPRLQKPVKRKERATAKRKLLQQEELHQRHLQRELGHQLKDKHAQRTDAAQSPAKGRSCCRCCLTPCCCGADAPGRDRDSIMDAEDDATHIASLSNHQSPSRASSCCACCWGKKKRTKKGTGSSQSAGSCAPGTKKKRCRRCCRKFAAFIFSHIGLCSLVVGYSIMGGFLFQWLESTDELQVRINVSKNRTHSVLQLWNMTSEWNILYKPNWTAKADEILREFQYHMFRSVKESGWDGRDESDEGMQWSLAGSLLYSITVITTIAFGLSRE